MSQHRLGELYRAVASHLKFAASQLYQDIAKEKSKRRKRGKRGKNGVIVQESKEEELYNVKDHIAKLILSLAQNLRSKDNIKLIFLLGQQGFKLISKKLDVSYQHLDLTDLKAEQEIVKNELCLQFAKEKQKYWKKYMKRIESRKNQKNLKPIVDHMLICEKLNWKIQNQIGHKKPREDLDALLQNATSCPTCSFSIAENTPGNQESQHSSLLQEMGSQIIHQGQMDNIESGMDISSTRPNTESMNSEEMNSFVNQREYIWSLFNDRNRFDDKIQRELILLQCEELIESYRLSIKSSSYLDISLDNIFSIESQQNGMI